MPYHENTSIVIYGGTGFIGTNFANYAARHGARVAVCGRGGRNSLLDHSIELFKLDAVDTEASLEFIERIRPDSIVFGISGITPRIQVLDPGAALTELRSLANVIQGAHKFGVKHLVYCSSGGAIYGDSAAAHVETDACLPKSLYGKLKVQSENLINTLSEPLNIPAAIMRIGNPYGPGQSPFGQHGVIAVFAHRMLTEKPITVFGSMEAAKDYIFVEDVSAAIWAALMRQVSGTFNVASGVPTKLKTLVRKISEVCSVEPILENVELGAAEVSTFTLDISKIRGSLDWNPSVDLDAGIAVTLDWIREEDMRQGVGYSAKSDG